MLIFRHLLKRLIRTFPYPFYFRCKVVEVGFFFQVIPYRFIPIPTLRNLVFVKFYFLGKIWNFHSPSPIGSWAGCTGNPAKGNAWAGEAMKLPWCPVNPGKLRALLPRKSSSHIPLVVPAVDADGRKDSILVVEDFPQTCQKYYINSESSQCPRSEIQTFLVDDFFSSVSTPCSTWTSWAPWNGNLPHQTSWQIPAASSLNADYGMGLLVSSPANSGEEEATNPVSDH